MSHNPGNCPVALAAPRATLRRLGVVLAVAGAIGCRDDPVGQLRGEWIGRPDTAAERQERESAASLPGPNESPLSSPLVDLSADQATTDWERYDATVRLEFSNGDAVALEMVDQGDPIRGTWRLVESTPGAVLIEITTPGVESASTGSQDGPVDQASEQRRRFELEPTMIDGKLVGFAMTESGADRQLGALYFERPEASRRVSQSAPANAPSP